MRHLAGVFAILLFVSLGAPTSGLAPVAADVRSSLRIEGDAQLDAAHGVVAGSGTAEDPFIISEYTQLVAPAYYGLSLVGTRAHVVIRDVVLQGLLNEPLFLAHCHVEAPGVLCDHSIGIELIDAQNVTIERVRTGDVPMSMWAIGAYRSENIVIQDVDLEVYLFAAFGAFGYSASGVDLRDVRNATVRDARIYADVAPLWIEDSVGIRIEGGTFETAIFRPQLYRTHDVTLRGVDTALGFNVVDSTDLRAIGNHFTGDGGLAFYTNSVTSSHVARNALLCGNTWHGTKYTGLAIARADDILVAGNVWLDPYRAWEIEDVGDLEMTRNLVRPDGYYSDLFGIDGLALHDNAILPGEGGQRLYGVTGSIAGNWWGDASGPAPAGSGAYLEGPLAAAPWLTAPPTLEVDCDALALPLDSPAR